MASLGRGHEPVEQYAQILVRHRSQAVEAALPDALVRRARTRLAAECAKLDPGLSNLLMASRFGLPSGSPSISPTAFLVDVCDKLYISGWGSNIGIGPPLTNHRPAGDTERDDRGAGGQR